MPVVPGAPHLPCQIGDLVMSFAPYDAASGGGDSSWTFWELWTGDDRPLRPAPVDWASAAGGQGDQPWRWLAKGLGEPSTGPFCCGKPRRDGEIHHPKDNVQARLCK